MAGRRVAERVAISSPAGYIDPLRTGAESGIVRPMKIITGVLAGVLLLGACSGTEENGPAPLAKARQTCVDRLAELDTDTEPGDYVALADDEKSLTVQSSAGGDIESIVTYVAAVCVLDELGAPSGVASKMETTTALMGRQTDEWDDYEVSWTYHPDNAYQVVIEDRG